VSLNGFYKRRRGILEHLESGKISLLDSGIHDFLSLKMNGVMGSGCSIPPGIVFASSRAICSQCSLGANEREVRRSLERLERLGWIKRWQTPGRHGNYPILIARASVHDSAGNEYRVNASETIDWREPVLILASRCPRDSRDVPSDRDLRIKNGQKPDAKAAAKTASPGDPRFKLFVDFASKAFSAKHRGTSPAWMGKDFESLKVLLARTKSISLDELQRRWDYYLASTDAFFSKQGDSLAFFCSKFDSFIDGPVSRAKEKCDAEDPILISLKNSGLDENGHLKPRPN
jgi:hypothetical protein